MFFNSPLSLEKADRLIGLFDLPPNGRILDVGCGSGEFLIRTIEAAGGQGLGVDLDPEAISTARDKTGSRIPDNSCEFRTADIQQASLPRNTFDLAICLGSTHAFGSGEAAYPNALKALKQLVSPGGQLLIGEGYWKQPPDPEYLTLIGEPVGIYHDHVGNITVAEQHGLVPLYAAVSSEDEWDHFEWSHRLRIEKEAAKRPNDEETAEKLKRSRLWRDGYLRWGRNTMGFGFYLFQKPTLEGLDYVK
jgi:ubiquinone/menaquinone biosynthesis C-methylase UbiE